MLESFEHKNQPLLTPRAFALRVLKSAVTAFVLIALSLALGAAGYHSFAHLGWLDATHSASMILTGMGPVHPMESDAARLFETCYALFSGVVFISSVGVFIAPVVHRFFHKFHLDEKPTGKSAHDGKR